MPQPKALTLLQPWLLQPPLYTDQTSFTPSSLPTPLPTPTPVPTPVPTTPPPPVSTATPHLTTITKIVEVKQEVFDTKPNVWAGSAFMIATISHQGQEYHLHIPGTTLNNQSSGKITIEIKGNNSSSTFTGQISSIKYYSRTAADVSGSVMKNGASIPITVTLRREAPKKWKLAISSQTPELNVPAQLASGTIKVGYREPYYEE